MEELPAGLYEVLLTEGLKERLGALAEALPTEQRTLRAAETPDRVAWHLGREIERALTDVPDKDRARIGIDVARALIDRLGEMIEVDSGAAPADPGTVLEAILGRRPDGSPAPMSPPLILLLDTTLLTNACPANQICGTSCDPRSSRPIGSTSSWRSSVVLHRPLVDALRRHCADGHLLRVLTTTYAGSTEKAALEQLADLGADVRVSYDLSTTRLHAKAWVFHRESGFSTAYVGSSNLTHSAQVTGIEWNVRTSAARNPDVLAKFGAVFESYWAGGDYRPFDAAQFIEEQERAGRTDSGPRVILSPIELRPEPFQERLLELLELSRQHGYRRNLLVSATGTGKTVMAALDYGALVERRDRSRLLFIAHRKEILDSRSPRSATHRETRPLVRSGWAVLDRHVSSTSSRRSKASTRPTLMRCHLITSTS